MNKVIAKRGRVKGCITLTATYASAIPISTTSETLEFRLEKLNEAWQEFITLQNELLDFIGTKDYVDRESEFAEYEAKYFETHALLTDAIRVKSKAHGSSEKGIAQGYHTPSEDSDMSMPYKSVKLPTITIEPFSGEYKDWPTFRDMFQGTVDSNRTITNTQKLHFLKSFLRGEAANLLKHIQCSENNYIEAWTRLEQRYDQKHLIVRSFIHSFLSLPSCNIANVQSLRKITNGADEAVRGLNALDTNTRDPWLIYLLLQKVDQDTKRAWAEEVGSRGDSTIHEFLEFLQTRCQCLEACSSFPNPTSTRAVRAHLVKSGPSCPKCQEGHLLSSCQAFKTLNIESRREFVRNKSLCFNCLRSGHASNNCRLTVRCHLCRSRHHSLLHSSQSQNSNQTSNQTSNFNSSRNSNQGSNAVSDSNHQSINSNSENPTPHSSNSLIANHSISFKPNHQVSTILPTAVARIRDNQGLYQIVRVLLDSGSQVSFITEQAAQRLGLPRKRLRIPVVGIASKSAGVTNGLVNLNIVSCYSSEMIDLSCYVLPTITSSLPPLSIDQIPQNLSSLNLADPNYCDPGPIDILIGADRVFNIIKGAAEIEKGGTLTSIPTIFGWVIAGHHSQHSPVRSGIQTFCTRLDHAQEFDLEKFWRLEEVSNEQPLSLEEQLAEENFVKSHTRLQDGRYEVQLPFKSTKLNFGDSFGTALARFHSIERKFNCNPNLKSEYTKFINEYISLGHMEEVPSNEILKSNNSSYYLPHHAIFKGDSSTTKIRVVFDASAKTRSSQSLNETLLVGPTIQRDIFSICLRSRRHAYLITGDIEKMYRQIRVSRNHTDFQRIVWRENPEEPLKHFRLLTVTYGTSAAPFLAVRVLQQLAAESSKTHPRASKTLLNDFYVDDVITGSDTIDDLISLRIELVELLKSAGFNLRKWTTNCWPLLISLPEDQRELSPVDFEESNSVKVLGLQWCPSRDIFSYKVKLNLVNSCTKRHILSDASKIFDPLGFLAPIVIGVKILLQELWRKQINWDEEVPDSLSQQWNNIRNELHIVENFAIPRIMLQNKNEWELHGFCDASLDAYAAVVYCRNIKPNNSISVTLVAAKSKVAPLKVLPLPRLELCGALLLVRLLNKIKISLQEPEVKTFAWTDSSIVLHWLAAPPKNWSVFIGNRTSEILTSLPIKSWNHVRSASNPADAATRGLLPSTLEKTTLWWEGPQWLSKTRDQWPSSSYNTADIDTQHLEERKVKPIAQVLHSNINSNHPFETIINNSSSWFKVVRVASYVFRFIENYFLPKEKQNLNPLFTEELFYAKIRIIKYVQSSLFYSDIHSLKTKNELSSKSRLLNLSPFIDSSGVLRVGGRLEHSNLTYSEKHPIILCKSHRVAKLIVDFTHKNHLHAGASLLFALIKQDFYILGCRNLARKVVRDCTQCIRQRKATSKQLMGNLPSERIRYARPFSRVGCDYAGPISLRLNRGRNPKFVKAYIALFVCFVTKAIHIELVGDLSSIAFLSALDRFVARRGKPCEIWSDNGTNFVGAKRLLNELYNHLCSQQHNNIVIDHLSKDNISWKFIPPSSPHFGGLWESGVRSIKLHLKRVIGDTILTYEEMYTLLTKIEALLNSRPMWQTSDCDPIALTPSHFLIGEAYTAVPQPDVSNSVISIKTNWSLLQAMLQGFWKRWHAEFLTSLQQRSKWQKSQPNLEVDDVVLLKEPNLPPSKWIVGRIIKTHPGADEKCRVVTIRTKFGDYVRPTIKIARLPCSERP
ncbi:uncharacterized protein LOC129945199 [Eupeodes corollae]|uniref:uncharacterized protein LOC129945199 n=1 Tax=Eupeodes corollae TaxID=290404 RepID=UPI00249023CB|nr:uncharacterized protein LOC129945199 [Eupeodes corollae]